MDLNDLNHLDKDPYDTFTKEDPFLTDVLTDSGYGTIGLPPTTTMGTFEVDNLWQNPLFTFPNEQVLSHQSLYKQLATTNTPENGNFWSNQSSTNNQQSFPDNLMNPPNFDPDEFLQQPKDCSNSLVMSSDGSYCGENLFTTQPSYTSHNMTGNTLVSQDQPMTPQPTTQKTRSVCDLDQIQAVVIKEEQHSPDIVAGQDQCNMKLTNNSPVQQSQIPTGNIKMEAQKDNINAANVRPSTVQNIDVKTLLGLLEANSKTAIAGNKHCNDIPPNTVAPSAFCKGEHAVHILQALGQNLTNTVQNVPNTSISNSTSKDISLQSLLQRKPSMKKEDQSTGKKNERAGTKRPRMDSAGQRNNFKQVAIKPSNNIVTSEDELGVKVSNVKSTDQPPHVPQLIITPGLVYSVGTTETTIPITVTRGNTVQPTPVIPNSALPLVLETSNIDLPDKIPIGRVRHSNSSQDSDSKPKTGGRSNHNEVEKRYRNKINKSLSRLSILVMGSGTKSTKSNILEKAIDKINDLKRINRKLQSENTKLRMSLKNLTLQDIIALTYNDNSSIQEDKRKRKGSYSSGDSMSDDPVCGDGESLQAFDDVDLNDGDDMSTENSSGSESVDSTGSFGLQDKTRVCLSIFLLAFMFFSPLKLLLPMQGPGVSSDHFSSRVLLSTKSNWDLYTGTQSYSSLIVHMILGFLIYLWILLKGEPGMPIHSRQRKYCTRLVAEARVHVNQKKFPAAYIKLQECLLLMGRGPPSSPVELAFGFLWNIGSFVMIQLGIMDLFKAVGWRILPGRKSAAQNKEEVEFSCSIAANAYLLLHDMGWIDPASRIGRIRRSLLWLRALNMADMAGSHCSHQLYVTIYANAALDVGITWPLIGTKFMRYFLSQAFRRHRVAPSDTPSIVSYLFHPTALQFLQQWKIPVRPAKEKNGIKKEFALTDAVARHFFLQQVSNILNNLVLKKCDQEENWFALVKTEISVINQCFPKCYSKCQPSNIQAFLGFTSWWQTLLHYLHQVSQLSKTGLTEGIQFLEDLKDGRNLGVRRMVANVLHSSITVTLGIKHPNLIQGSVEARMRQVEEHLKELKQESVGNSSQKFSELEKLCIIVACELLLTARFKLWEENEVDVVSEAELNQAEMSLDFLQYFDFADLKSKVRSYSMILRHLSGCNPITIMRDLQYNSWYSCNETETDAAQKKPLRDKDSACQLVASAAQILRYGITPNDKIRSKLRSIEKCADGRENTAIRRACKKALGSGTRGS